jgi:hypothetical protein
MRTGVFDKTLIHLINKYLLYGDQNVQNHRSFLHKGKGKDILSIKK